MTLRSCYRATCDVTGCAAAEMLPHERSGPARLALSTLGWTTIEFRESASGAPRLLYVCPVHHGWRPSDDGRVLSQMSMAERRGLKVRRSAVWCALHWVGAPIPVIAEAAGITPSRAAEVVAGYERVVARRVRDAQGWQEPWAKRLRAAGAIR